MKKSIPIILALGLLAGTLSAWAVQQVTALRIGPNPSTTLLELTSYGEVKLTERAAIGSTPAAGYGYLWVKNTAPSTLVFTDDAGTDTTLGSGGGSGITALTGDVTASGSGSVAATIAAGAVDPAMLSATGTPSGSTYLRGDNTWATVSGTGDVVGPASATDNAVVRFDATTGKLVQNSVVTIADTTGDVAGVGTLNTHTIPGGTGTLALTSQITGTNSGTNTGDVSLTGTPDYITLSGQTITRGLVDLTTDVTGELPDANVSNTLTASKLVGSGSTSDAVDLDTGETAGDLPLSKIAQFAAGTFAGRELASGTGDLVAMSNVKARESLSNISAMGYTYTAPDWHATWSPATGSKFNLTLAHNTLIDSATGNYDGQLVLIIITKVSTYTVTWNSQFKALDGTTSSIPAIPATAGDIAYYYFIYNQYLDDWVLQFHAEYQPL